MCSQAQQSELQSLLRLTQSTEEEQGQGKQAISFRALVLNRDIAQSLAQYTVALFTTPEEGVGDTADPSGQTTGSAATESANSTADAAGSTASTAVSLSTAIDGAQAGAAGTAGSADAAGTAGAAGIADLADAAGTASTASTAGTAGTANSAGPAYSLNTAGTAGTPGSAGSAGPAHSLNTAGTAGAPGSAEKAAELCKQSSEQWGTGIQKAGLPWALQLLAAFSQHHQVCVQQVALPADTTDAAWVTVSSLEQ